MNSPAEMQLSCTKSQTGGKIRFLVTSLNALLSKSHFIYSRYLWIMTRAPERRKYFSKRRRRELNIKAERTLSSTIVLNVITYSTSQKAVTSNQIGMISVSIHKCRSFMAPDAQVGGLKHYCGLILYTSEGTVCTVYRPIATDMFQKICISCLPLPEKNWEAFYLATTNITHYHIPLLKDSFISFMRSLTRFFPFTHCSFFKPANS